MVPDTVIGVGFSNLCVLKVRDLLTANVGDRVLVTPIFNVHDEPRPYDLGKQEAQEIAVKLSRQYKASLSIGIICVTFHSPNPKFVGAKVDIATIIERGVLLEREVPLNPISCKRAALGRSIHEALYAHEAAETLVELVKTRRRGLLLEHIG